MLNRNYNDYKFWDYSDPKWPDTEITQCESMVMWHLCSHILSMLRVLWIVKTALFPFQTCVLSINSRLSVIEVCLQWSENMHLWNKPWASKPFSLSCMCITLNISIYYTRKRWIWLCLAHEFGLILNELLFIDTVNESHLKK